jgi:dUTP pyrophosphatase
VKVKVVNTSNHPLPAYQTTGAAGLDLLANIDEKIILGSLERVLVPTGIFMELPSGYEAQIRPRSGLALKRGISVLNSPGTIDEDYRGELKVLLVNLSNETSFVEPGERIAQMIIAPYQQIQWVEVDVLSNTERGRGGYGHTGTI